MVHPVSSLGKNGVKVLSNPFIKNFMARSDPIRSARQEWMYGLTFPSFHFANRPTPAFFSRKTFLGEPMLSDALLSAGLVA